MDSTDLEEWAGDDAVGHGRRMAIGSILEIGAQAIAFPAAIATTAFLTRQLGPEQFGVLTVASTIVLIIELTTIVVFSRITVKFVAEAKEWQSAAATLVQIQFFIGVLTALLLVGISPFLAWLLDTPELSNYLRLLALDIPIVALYTGFQFTLIGRGAFTRRTVVSASGLIGRLVLIFLLVGLGFSLKGALLAFIGASLIQLVVGLVFVRMPLLKLSAFPIREIWKYALPLFLYSVAMILFSRIDLLLVTALTGSREEAGFYGAAQMLTIVPGSLFSAAVAPLLISTLSRLLRHNQIDDAIITVTQITRAMFFLLPLAGIGAGASLAIADLMYGEPFQPAAPLIGLLAFAALALALISVNTAILTALGHPKKTFMLIGPLVALGLVAHLIFIPRFGPISAACITAVLAWVGVGLTMFAVHQRIGFALPLATFARIGAATVITFGLAIVWQATGWWLILQLISLTSVAVAILIILRELTISDLTFVRILVKKGGP